MIELFKKKETQSKKLDKSEWPTHVITLDRETFNDFIDKYPLTLVDFWAPWCKPCKTMLPRLRRLERLFQGRVAFARLNTEQEKDLSKKYDIIGIPHFGFFRYGKKIGMLTGVKSVGDMKDSIESYLSKYT
jgi:thioredoxin-like negative regulator of GroEL